MLKKFDSSLWYAILFSSTGALLVLWHLLLPGYIILLDWVPGPYLSFSYTNVGEYIQAPSSLLIACLGLLFPSWVVQKIIFFGLIFSLFFIPIIFYPWKKVSFVQYATSLFAVCNPFVYERLLTGQWRVGVGYICLFPLFYFLFRWSNTRSRASLLGVFGTLFLTGFWSIHFLAIGIVITFVYIATTSILLLSEKKYQLIISSLKQVVIGSILFLVGSLYWIIPYSQSETNVLEHFASDDFSAFETARDAHIGVVLNVITMRGFWVERHAWAEQFTLPGSSPWMFYSAFIALIILAYFGYTSLQTKEEKRTRVSISIIYLSAIIFAAGISALFIWKLNYWLLEHVSFWNGFRETHKWTGVAVVLYALLAGRGLAYVYEHWRYRYRRVVLISITMLIAIFLVPKLFFGLGGQVSTVWYPESWLGVNSILTKSPECRALFLPWHQYYAVTWNSNRLSGNPSTQAFDCEVVSGQNTELGNMKSFGDHIADYTAIEHVVTSNSKSDEHIAKTITTLRASGVEYIVVSTDLIDRDIYLYPFLNSPDLIPLYERDDVRLFRIR